MNLLSTAVKAFPLGKPRAESSEDITSRIFYEQNVSNLIRQIVDVPGFLITSPTISNTGALASPLEFNLGGYYFRIRENTVIFPLENGVLISAPNIPLTAGTGYIYACINVTTGADNLPVEITGQDNDSGYFTSLEIVASNSAPTEFTGYSYFLPIYSGQVSNTGAPTGSWTIVNNSFQKFNLLSLNITGIDGQN